MNAAPSCVLVIGCLPRSIISFQKSSKGSI